MRDFMLPPMPADAVLLLMDTCAERASLALFRGQEQIAQYRMQEREASTRLRAALKEVLAEGDVPCSALAGVGITSGPGSFTGLRIGLAFAKGFCEVTGLPLAAVSRLEVLAEAADLCDGMALIGAGRDLAYVREVLPAGDVVERLVTLKELAPRLPGKEVVVTSSALEEQLIDLGAAVTCVDLEARHALCAVQRCFARGGSDPASVDANYVRSGNSIYARAVGVS